MSPDIVADPLNPTLPEILRWAYSDELWPDPENWNLYVGDLRGRPFPVYLTLAVDDSCPQQAFFFDCIYHIAGDVFRSKGDRRMHEPGQVHVSGGLRLDRADADTRSLGPRLKARRASYRTAHVVSVATRSATASGWPRTAEGTGGCGQ